MDTPQESAASMIAGPRNGFAITWGNRNAFASPKRRYLGLFVLLTIVDALQTTHIVSRFGNIAEINPVMRMVLEHFSITGLWWIKAFAILAVLLALDRIRPVVLFGSVVLMAVVVASNMLQMWTAAL